MGRWSLTVALLAPVIPQSTVSLLIFPPGPAVSAGPGYHPGQKLWLSCPTVLQLDQHGSLSSQYVMIERLGDVQKNIHQQPLTGGSFFLPLSLHLFLSFSAVLGRTRSSLLFSPTNVLRFPGAGIFGLGSIRPLVLPVAMVLGCFSADC